ncbi:manganese-dependent inorganic pyrophosphatase [candidate division CPR3 bacterium GWF2_35_18]|uniref:inorganic diphosphatase n=1 Tax=candidate division CPR3 bacterium GW2011_GWF2_35_18 TaxID=1618350 RepID=A0A0G0ES33_UNCC3|nr:MAG: hypothetical protein UR67_C0001G0086 [candidate division CPR3 bacterium GW2011_GWF2_35_18]KKP86053.1 MAG: hypothetical protein UR87_C0032G0006 [candidate division CPR3 bacterium GW2011_GWE2_35_7]OGB63397.1 MAG: manganese-dependent inorganic pyrophosphatase [candidate division CPR3 bacterium GWF2_35_18]OGB64858.1 MAG: manganese-dependent inorganic pyrophosphatase [candidate division CPR3 bacterium RIFOXYA2_FULL_35_13]OGB76743.1 MAG: manganese-dependent inorganic pyrophosphatase [candidat
MSDQIYITGHKNPDTDSICSAIAYAELKRSLGINAIPMRCGETNEETNFALEKFGYQSPELVEDVKEKSIVLIDHNESNQSPNGIEEAEIVEVLDHHKINFNNSKPLIFFSKPVGCTATLVYEKYLEAKVALTKNVAGILLSAILSDTIVFKGPTTTVSDVEIAKTLAKIANITDLEKFGIELKKQKASLFGKSATDLINSDLKEFNFKDKKVAIGQIEIVENSEFESRKKEILTELQKIKEAKNLSLIAFMATNIIEMGTTLLCVGETEIIEKAFHKKVAENSVYLKNVMSRKKDIVPPLEKAFS